MVTGGGGGVGGGEQRRGGAGIGQGGAVVCEERRMRVAAAELNQNTKSIRTCRWRLLCRLERRPCLHDVPLT